MTPAPSLPSLSFSRFLPFPDACHSFLPPRLSDVNQPHDAAYKLLFSHPAMVADLLRGFLAEEWCGELDLDGLEAVAESHLSDDLRERRNDCIWRIPWRDPDNDNEPVWLYIYLLLEFQSRPDPTMPVRMLTYLGLLYQDLIRAREVQPQALPPVLPVVLYNGQPEWRTPVQMAKLIPRYPAAMDPLIPRMQYVLLDEGRMAISRQYEERNLAAAVFRIEQHATPEGIQAVADALNAWLDHDDQAPLRSALETWLVQSVVPASLPGVELPAIVRLGEVRAMLGERLRSWGEGQRLEGRQEGRQEGECHALVTLIRHQVDAGLLTIDQAREQIRALMADGDIPLTAGERALEQLG